jgi:RNA polymerase sigma-70 factor (ECF subfamily)
VTGHAHSPIQVDEVLLYNTCGGCADCFALLFSRYFRQVFAISFRILRDRSEAEDILQEVFLDIYLQRERFDPTRGSVRTWVLQFAYFKSLLRRRYLQIRRFYSAEELLQAQELRANTSADVLGMNSSEWGCCVEKGLGALGSKQRQAIELVHFGGHTLQETSEIMGETLANTRNHYYRGMKALRTFFNVELAERKFEGMVPIKNAYPMQS